MAFLDLLLFTRPKQWTKNLLVFAAPLFVSDQLEPGALSKSLVAFAAMCLASGAVYAFNDLSDVEQDRAHPTKRNRPVASGRIGRGEAGFIGALELIGALALAWAIGAKPFIVVLVYVGLQAVYVLGAKRVPVTDVFLIGTGFVLRAALGAIAIQVQISAWLLLCTGALALLLGFGKRRSEFVLQGDARAASRESLGAYSKQALDVLVTACATVAAICYGIYAVESQTAKSHPALILSSVFVFYGICRYLFLAFGADEGGEPETLLLTDVHLIASVVLFVGSVLLAFSGFRMGFVN
ncbi:MAG: decaprenyl-phosphate phosphoribosyltransferase [Chthonomonadaceae bacterium]|nr:decaprenyl-phosphate phosphoribosyltransferase [Chthonomonadaceae bacterium]